MSQIQTRAGRDGLRALLEKHRRVVGITGAVGATALAGLWLVVVPERAAEASGLRELTIRYGHSLCWGLLAIAAVLHSARAPRRYVEVAAWSGLAAYAGFLLAMFL